MTTPFSAGEWVLLTSQKGKKWLVRIEDAPFSNHLGTVQLGDLVGREEGESLVTSKGAKLFAVRPALCDFITKMKRLTQIIYPKDLAAILFYGDIRPGDTVLESGLGSGALALAVLRAIGPTGRLISIEKRTEFALLARRNIERYSNAPQANHCIVVADIHDAALNVAVDRILLDLPEPWHAVAPIARFMKMGGILVSLSPNVGQVQLTYRQLKWSGFANINTFELLQRDWLVDDRRARPRDRMVAHTGFITVAKRMLPAGPPAELEDGPPAP
jgi:tRNA (adenine57-N1/adenine58-N1)-methyltransferase